jgi:hypothetical protein
MPRIMADSGSWVEDKETRFGKAKPLAHSMQRVRALFDSAEQVCQYGYVASSETICANETAEMRACSTLATRCRTLWSHSRFVGSGMALACKAPPLYGIGPAGSASCGSRSRWISVEQAQDMPLQVALDGGGSRSQSSTSD